MNIAKVIHIETDVSDKERVKKSVAWVSDEFGCVDILTNNAGIITPLNLSFEQTDDDWDRVIKVNLYGTFYVMKEIVPMMMRQRYGRIVNISSGVARSAACGRANYAVSKGGIEMLTMTAAMELGEYGITVNVVRPSFTVTPMTVSRGYDFNALAKGIPRQRLGTPEGVARIVRFLADEAGDDITGQIISADGGLGICGSGLMNQLAPLKAKGSEKVSFPGKPGR